MKALTILVIVIFSTASVHSEGNEFIRTFVQKIFKYSAKCIIESHASAGDVSELISLKYPSRHEGQCLLFCFHKNFHIQKPDGSFDDAGALEALEPLKGQDLQLYEKILNILQVCNEKITYDEDPCVTATNLEQCAKEEGVLAGVDQTYFNELSNVNKTIIK